MTGRIGQIIKHKAVPLVTQGWKNVHNSRRAQYEHVELYQEIWYSQIKLRGKPSEAPNLWAIAQSKLQYQNIVDIYKVIKLNEK